MQQKLWGYLVSCLCLIQCNGNHGFDRCDDKERRKLHNTIQELKGNIRVWQVPWIMYIAYSRCVKILFYNTRFFVEFDHKWMVKRFVQYDIQRMIRFVISTKWSQCALVIYDLSVKGMPWDLRYWWKEAYCWWTRSSQQWMGLSVW